MIRIKHKIREDFDKFITYNNQNIMDHIEYEIKQYFASTYDNDDNKTFGIRGDDILYLYAIEHRIFYLDAYRLIKNSEYEIKDLYTLANGKYIEPWEDGKKSKLGRELISYYNL